MNISSIDPPRRFLVGAKQDVQITHSADIELDADEQVTFVSEGTEYDVVGKSWGYYATPSLNRRLPAHGLNAVLVTNRNGDLYLLLVKEGREQEFEQYLDEHDLHVRDRFSGPGSP